LRLTKGATKWLRDLATKISSGTQLVNCWRHCRAARFEAQGFVGATLKMVAS
jgi:hypothetical protein